MKNLAILLIILSIELFPQNNLINISGSGSNPSIVYDNNGSVFVTWQNLDDAIHLKRYDFSGNSVGDEFTYSNTAASLMPCAAANSSCVINVWDDRFSNIVSDMNSYIKGNVSSINSLDTNKYILFSTSAPDAMRYNPNVCFINDTTFLIVWNGNGDSTTSSSAIYGQICTVSGNFINDNFLITDHYKNQIANALPKIIYKNGEDKLIITWEDNSSGKNNLYGRIFNTSGAPIGSSFLISDDTAMTYMFYYSAAMDTAGNFAVVWAADKGKRSQIEWRWYNKDGNPVTNVEQLTSLDTIYSSAGTVDISIDENGRTVLEWEQIVPWNSSNANVRIMGQRFNADKSKLGSVFEVFNDTSSFEQNFANVVFRNGKIFSVWECNGIQGNILDFDKIDAVVKPSRNEAAIKSYTLNQNYPNPFNPSTNISWQMPVKGHVVIKIYNILGREIETLTDRDYSAGSHTLNWNASKYSSGVYFYKLNAGGYILTRKMLLIK